MVFRIVVGVVAGVVARGDEVYQHHSSARSSLEESALTSMRVDRFFLRVEEKNPTSPWRASLESTNLALARVYDFLPRADEELASSMRVEEDARGRCAGMAPLRHRGTSLSWRGDRLHGGRRTETRPRGLLLAEPPPRVAGHTYDRDEAATETRKAKAGEGDRRRKEGLSVY
jgi:hypothetical protein